MQSTLVWVYKTLPSQFLQHYASKLKKRLDFAYKVAAREAQKSADRNKANYDLKVREATLDVGDHVLIRNVGLRRKNKLADKWDKDPYVVIDIPDRNVPVYKVQRESGNPTVKTLHRNMLLPFSAIPVISEIRPIPSVTQPPKQKKNLNSAPKPSLLFLSLIQILTQMSQLMSQYIFPPHRRNKFHKIDSPLNSSVDRSPVLTHDSTHRESSNNVDRTPSAAVGQADSTGSIQTDSLGSKGRESSVDSTGNQSEQSLGTSQVEQEVEQQVGPRSSGRIRQPPDWYGEWLTNQHTVEEWVV